MDILDDMGVSKLSVKVFLKVNYSFNLIVKCYRFSMKLLVCGTKAFLPFLFFHCE